MSDNDMRDDDKSVERQIKYEKAQTERFKAEERATKAKAKADVARMKAEARIEYKMARQEARRARADARREAAGNVMRNRKSRKIVFIVIAALVAAAVVFVTVVWPLMNYKPKTEYFATSTLEKIVKTSNLSTVDCIYNGIAEKEPTYVGPIQTVAGYSAKYNSRVKVSYDLAAVKVRDENGKLVVYLPEPEIGDPILDGKLSFIPEGYDGDYGEALKICKEDAKQELMQESSIIELANENIERTLKSLIKPLVDKNKTIEFKPVSEYPSEVNNEA